MLRCRCTSGYVAGMNIPIIDPDEPITLLDPLQRTCHAQAIKCDSGALYCIVGLQR